MKVDELVIYYAYVVTLTNCTPAFRTEENV